MKVIQAHLPEQHFDDIDELVDKGVYPSRAEAVRAAIREKFAEDG